VVSKKLVAGVVGAVAAAAYLRDRDGHGQIVMITPQDKHTIVEIEDTSRRPKIVKISVDSVMASAFKKRDRVIYYVKKRLRRGGLPMGEVYSPKS
jgi:hypothetical protein